MSTYYFQHVFKRCFLTPQQQAIVFDTDSEFRQLKPKQFITMIF